MSIQARWIRRFFIAAAAWITPLAAPTTSLAQVPKPGETLHFAREVSGEVAFHPSGKRGSSPRGTLLPGTRPQPIPGRGSRFTVWKTPAIPFGVCRFNPDNHRR